MRQLLRNSWMWEIRREALTGIVSSGTVQIVHASHDLTWTNTLCAGGVAGEIAQRFLGNILTLGDLLP